MTTLLPLGVLKSNALPGESYRLALTPGLITRIFGARVTDAILLEGGYVHPAGEANWWLPSGRFFYSPLARGKAMLPLAPIVFSWLSGRGAASTRLDPHDARSSTELRQRLAVLMRDQALFTERIVVR